MPTPGPTHQIPRTGRSRVTGGRLEVSFGARTYRTRQPVRLAAATGSGNFGLRNCRLFQHNRPKSDSPQALNRTRICCLDRELPRGPPVPAAAATSPHCIGSKSPARVSRIRAGKRYQICGATVSRLAELARPTIRLLRAVRRAARHCTFLMARRPTAWSSTLRGETVSALIGLVRQSQRPRMLYGRLLVQEAP